MLHPVFHGWSISIVKTFPYLALHNRPALWYNRSNISQLTTSVQLEIN